MSGSYADDWKLDQLLGVLAVGTLPYHEIVSTGDDVIETLAMTIDTNPVAGVEVVLALTSTLKAEYFSHQEPSQYVLQDVLALRWLP